MKTKILFFLIISLSLLLLAGCEKDIPIPDPEPPVLFTLDVTSPVTEAEFGDSILITIKTSLCDSVAYKILDDAGREIVIHEYSRPADLIGEWTIVDTLFIVKIGLNNQAYVDAFHFLPDGKIEVKNQHVNVMGYFPEVTVTGPEEVSWKSGAEVTIISTHGDYILTNLPGYNGILNGTFTTSPLDSTGTYYVALHSKRNVSWRNVTIYVAEPTMSDTLSSKMGSWSGIVAIAFEIPPGGVWMPGEPRLCFSDDTTTYCPDSRMIANFGEIKCGTEPTMKEFNWSLEGKALILSNNGNVDIREIVFLSSDTLVWTYHPLGAQLMTRETFIRIHNN